MNVLNLDDTRVLPFPDVDALRRAGWSVAGMVGQYAVAFRGAEEVVFAWRNAEWQIVGGRTGTARAA